MKRFARLLAISPFLFGCAALAPDEVVDPGQVTVQAAITDVAQGLANFNKINRRAGINSGMLVDELSITLNLGVSAQDSRQMVVNFSPDLSGANSASAQGTFSEGSNANRANTVTLRFRNLYTVALNAAGQKAAEGIDPENLTTFGTARGEVTVDCAAPKNDAEVSFCMMLSQ